MSRNFRVASVIVGFAIYLTFVISLSASLFGNNL